MRVWNPTTSVCRRRPRRPPYVRDRDVPLATIRRARSEQRGSGLGQRDAAVPPGEQLRAQPRLQRPHLLRQRGLGDEEDLGGPGEAQLVGDGQEGAQVAHVHVARVRHSRRLSEPALDGAVDASATLPSCRPSSTIPTPRRRCAAPSSPTPSPLRATPCSRCPPQRSTSSTSPTPTRSTVSAACPARTPPASWSAPRRTAPGHPRGPGSRRSRWAGRWPRDGRSRTADLGVVPDGVDLVVAAALPAAGVTALRVVRRLGSLLGRRVLVTGASGGVGRYAVQLAALAGAHVVAQVGSVERGAGLPELGAAEVVTDLAGVAPVDGVVDNVGGPCSRRRWPCSPRTASPCRSGRRPGSRRRSTSRRSGGGRTPARRGVHRRHGPRGVRRRHRDAARAVAAGRPIPRSAGAGRGSARARPPTPCAAAGWRARPSSRSRRC